MNHSPRNAITTPEIEHLLEAATQLWRCGKLDEAAAIFSKIKEIAPRNEQLLRFTAHLASAQSEHAQAIPIYEELLVKIRTDADLWFEYGIALSGNNEHLDAIRAFDRCLELRGKIVPSLLYRGLCLEKAGKTADAIQSYLMAIRSAEKQKEVTLNKDARALLTHASNVVRQQLYSSIQRYMSPIGEKHGQHAIERIQQCAEIFAGRTRANFAHPQWKPGLFYVPGLPPKPFFERIDLPALQALEECTEIIRRELLGIMKDESFFLPYVNHPKGSKSAETWRELNQSKDWSTYHFFRHGKKIDENCERCPETAKIIESMDLTRIPGYGPEVMFSVLKPKTRIKAHHGPINGRLIVHLPLIVPEDCGAIRVGPEKRTWQEGQCLIFDDAFEHEAWNESDQERVVLILDVWNPHLSPAEREAFIALHRAAQDFERGLV